MRDSRIIRAAGVEKLGYIRTGGKQINIFAIIIFSNKTILFKIDQTVYIIWSIVVVEGRK